MVDQFIVGTAVAVVAFFFLIIIRQAIKGKNSNNNSQKEQKLKGGSDKKKMVKGIKITYIDEKEETFNEATTASWEDDYVSIIQEIEDEDDKVLAEIARSQIRKIDYR